MENRKEKIEKGKRGTIFVAAGHLSAFLNFWRARDNGAQALRFSG
jgi:hypothetical protein